jgi:hypothetical protein
MSASGCRGYGRVPGGSNEHKGWYERARRAVVGATAAGAAPAAVMAGAGAYYMAPLPFKNSFLLIFFSNI